MLDELVALQLCHDEQNFISLICYFVLASQSKDLEQKKHVTILETKCKSGKRNNETWVNDSYEKDSYEKS